MIKYQHIEKYKTDETEGIDIGVVHIFPKLDGTSGSVCLDKETGKIKAGSRNRELTLEEDNQGFYDHILHDENQAHRFINLFKKYPNLVLFGEFLIPHSLKTYRDDAWRKFYVFDVIDVKDDQSYTYYTYEEYSEILKEFDIMFIDPIAIIENPSENQIMDCLEKNTYLIKDDSGTGEGIVLKNYSFVNKYGRITWAKVVKNEFKELHRRKSKKSVDAGEITIEQKIADKFCTEALIDKCYDKVRNQNDGWSNKSIPEFLGLVWHDFINEEIWQILKKYKNPNIDFKKLNLWVNIKIKKYRADLF